MQKAVIGIRASPTQRDLIDRAAHLLGSSCSNFVLEAACEKAQSVVLDQVFFKLDAAKFHQFVKLLDTPPTRNPGLVRLMAVVPPWTRKAAKG